MTRFNTVKKTLFLALVLGILLSLCMMRAPVSEAAPATSVSISPPTQTVASGQPFTVNVAVAPDVAIAGVQFDLSFNPSLITANSVTEGNLLNQGGVSTYFSPGTIDNGAGTITGVAGAITTSGQTVSNPGTFAIINFIAGGGSGSSPLDLANVIVGDINGNPVQITVSDGTVTVGCVTPGTPSLVSPSNGLTGVSTTPTLDWSDVSGAVSYDVQVCNDNGCTSVVRSANVSSSQWTVLPALNQGTLYWWRARAKNSCGSGSWSSVWSFTTVVNNPPNMPSNPSPSNHVTNVSINADLSWTGGDPDAGDTMTYDVYFGTSSTPPFRETIGPYPATQSLIAYDPGALAGGAKYYWRIVATDNHGASAIGPLWDFTIISEPDINIFPSSFDVWLPPNTIQPYTLTISNVGGATLTYSIGDKETTGGASVAGGENLSSVERASMVLEVPLESSLVEPKNIGADASGWQNIMTDGFEGAFPGAWELWVDPGATNAYWGKDNYRAHSGIYSIFCAKSGSAGVNPPAEYPTNMKAWMIYGPFSLADATDAELNFYCWLDSEYHYDYLEWMASVDGSDFYGWSWTGNSGGWVSESLDLTDVYTLGNLCGQSQVWIAFIFESDEDISYKGAFIDDVVLRKYVAANNPPNIPSNPTPANHATEVSINADLSWTGGDPDAGDTVTYDVYFGTSSSPPLVSNDQLAITYDPGTLNSNTKYYWKIVATDNHGASITGPLWDFTTGLAPNNPPNVPSNPSPANHAAGVSVNADLSWTSGDPDAGDTVTYDVYFGTSSPPPLVSDDQLVTTFDLGTMAYNKKYYWKIVATDNHGALTSGPVWDFTTGGAAGDCPWLDENPKSGSVPAGERNKITVIINTTGLALGNTYTAEIDIANNDPDGNPKVVPVKLRVGPTVAWNIPWGLDEDPQAINIYTYQGVAVTLADIDGTMPDGLLIWYYGGPGVGYKFYKKGWGAYNTLTTLVPNAGLIGIVPTASVWYIPQS